MRPPLDGITVVALEQAVSGPFATRQLADLGARVIKIERTGTGDFARVYDTTVRGMASSFIWCNRSKESVTLDLKHPRGAEIIARLLAGADVFLQNLAPGAAARLGLSFEQLHAKLPRLIVCDISGYGDSGPYRDKKAYDLLIQAESGLVSTSGTPDQPAKTGISIADICAGMYAYSGILAALLQRARTGVGSRVEISMFEALCEWMSFPLYYANCGGLTYHRCGASHSVIVPYGPFATADGKTVMLGIQNEREWKTFCEFVIKRPELIADPRFDTIPSRVRNREILVPIVQGILGQFSKEVLLGLLDSNGIANSQLNSLADVWNHPQLAFRNRWRSVESPVGAVPALVPPGMPSDAEPRMDPVPELGANVDSVLMELGYSAGEIAEMRAEGTV